MRRIYTTKAARIHICAPRVFIILTNPAQSLKHSPTATAFCLDLNFKPIGLK